MPEQGSPGSAPIALTMGDPAGIGLDITLAAWHARRARGLAPFLVYGCPVALAQRAAVLGLPAPIEIVEAPERAARIFSGNIPVFPVPLPAAVVAGTPDSTNASAVIAAIELAVKAVAAGQASAVVTNPISKSILQSAGFAYPGHTEFLAALAEHAKPGQRYRPVMMLSGAGLRVVPLTIHIPLSQVPTAISRQLVLETVHTVWDALRHDFSIPAPRMAVAGLNPHAGEDGTMGTEENALIAPAIASLRAEGLAITGPHPADTLFHAARRATYDAAVCMYHDQALIPLKTLAFDVGVNITLGLPFVRTSPDHGTAFGIAGKGAASPESLIASLQLARELSTRRAGAAR